MRVNKDTQYGVLFTLYIARAGRAKVSDAADNLGLSESFLAQIARKLRLAGVINSVKGPGGGYELNGEPKMSQVFKAFTPDVLLTTKEIMGHMRGGLEQRSFVHYIAGIDRSMRSLLDKKITVVMRDYAAGEAGKLDSLDLKGLEN